MSGFNLPDGCSVNDIPGNRPEDLWRDRLWEDVEASPDLFNSVHGTAISAEDWGYLVKEDVITQSVLERLVDQMVEEGYGQ